MRFFNAAFCVLLMSAGFSAAADFDFDCTVTKVTNQDFEDVNDFKFADYPNVSYRLAGKYGKTLIVGAFNFAEQDPDQPSKIEVSQDAKNITVTAKPEESGTVYKVSIVNGAARVILGKLFWTEDGVEKQVAELSCE